MWNRIATLLLVLTLGAANANARESIQTGASLAPTALEPADALTAARLQADDERRDARKLTTSGAVLMTLGVVLGAVAWAPFAIDGCPGGPGGEGCFWNKFTVGITAGTLSASAFLVGTPLLVAGQNKARRLRSGRFTLEAAAPNVSATGGGMTFSGRF